MFTFCLHDLLHRTVTRNGKSELVKEYWFSPQLFGLLDYFIHKSPYWSVHNYEQRLDEDIRESFMRHCMKVHKAGRQDLTGESRAFQRPNYMSTLPFMVTDSDAVTLRSLQKFGCHGWRRRMHPRRTMAATVRVTGRQARRQPSPG